MIEQRYSDKDVSKRDIPSFIEPRPPLIQNPFMRPRPQKGTNLMELFEDSEIEEPECPDQVQVYLRLKPCSVPNSLYEVRSERCLVTSLDTATAGHGRRTQHNVSKMYTFSKIFGPECNQKEVFEAVVKDNLKKLPDGHSFTLLTYGASGSGKTYTLMGTVREPGLVPRSLEYVFRLVDAAQQPLYKPAEGGAEKLHYAEQDYEIQWVKRLRHVSAPLRDKYRRMSAQLHSDLTTSSIDLTNRIKHYVWVSFVEIYNEAIYDLLAPPDKRTKLRIREDSSGHVYVKDATQAFVRSGEEAYDVMVAGKHNLVVAATGVHAHSSRSHCIFTITMLTETEGEVRTSCVRLCDLAGCERARATHNTGARMAESRAINSSLHVLERCLHMLRRKQRQRQEALVPYRESKLTRLLGSGLSGARGEAVSMVVTLNPSPEYAHETKHVLTLAAVAQDIQINNTILGSTLESTAQDTTVNCSAEVMKLRADNERLHFELVQAQARNKELLAAMEERQQEAASTMRELVEEAKDMTRQYYEAQLQALRSQMDDMIEEYESRLEPAKVAPTTDAGTPSRNVALQNKIAELMTEIAVLEEKLIAEQLARARAEKEVQHLRTCIEERDEKAFKETTPPNDGLSLSDSEYDSDGETDPFNESLEPIFKMDQNRSLAVQEKHSVNGSVHTIDNINEEDEADLEVSNDTLKHDEDTPTKSLLIDENLSQNANKTNEISDKTFEGADSNITIDKVESNDVNLDDSHNENDVEFKDVCNDFKVNDESIKINKSDSRSTYFVKDLKADEIEKSEDIKLKKINTCRGSYCVRDTECRSDNRGISKFFDNDEKDIVDEIKCSRCVSKEQKVEKVSETLVNKIIQSLKSNTGSDSSLRQFEQLEKAARSCDDDAKQNETVFGEIKMLKEKRNYFDDNMSKEDVIEEVPENNIGVKLNKEKRTYFDNIDVNVEVAPNKKIDEIKVIDDDRSPSIVKDVASDNFEPSTIKKLLGESISKADKLLSLHKPKHVKIHDSVDMFEGLDSPGPVKIKEKVDNVEKARRSIEKLVLNQQSAKKSLLQTQTTTQDSEPIIEEASDTAPTEAHAAKVVVQDTPQVKNDPIILKTDIKLESSSSIDKDENNMIIDMKKEDMKKEIKLEPILSLDEPNNANETQNISKENNTIEEFENICKDLTTSRATEFDLLVSQEIDESIKTDIKEDAKYNLRNKQSRTRKVSDSKHEEILAESHSKLEAQPRKRNLRLRRKKNDDDDQDKLNLDEQPKLKDIVNLQSEFSDVTMDVPAPKKELKDIPSPEKCEEENVPPVMGIQSCPSKTITRSRRKLFTPRAEPLEESLGQTGDSNERVYVPRPSYHRPRARRKL